MGWQKCAACHADEADLAAKVSEFLQLFVCEKPMAGCEKDHIVL